MTDELPNEVGQFYTKSISRVPCGQIGWFLVGTAFCLAEIVHTAPLLGLGNPSTNETLTAIAGLLIFSAIGCAVIGKVFRMWLKRRGEQPAHLPWLRKLNFALFGITVLLTMVSLIIPAMHAARAAQSRFIASGPWVDHLFDGDSVQISTPANWVNNADAAITNSGISLSDRQNDLHLVATVISKEDIAIHSLAEFSSNAARNLTKGATGVTVGESRLTEVDGHPAIHLGVIATFDGVNLCFYFRHVEYDDAWAEVRLCTTRSRIEENEATFAKIAGSIRRKQ